VTCPAWETLVAYFAGDLGAGDEGALEEHLFSCDACAREAARVAAVTETIRADVPLIVRAADVAALRARGLTIHENAFSPGEHKDVPFAPGVDLLIHRLGGLDLSGATRVAFTIGEAATGRAYFHADGVPFDREAGAVLVACQRHYDAFPPDCFAEVRVVDAAGAETVTRYGILHRFI
jgi:anti-sigma factor RsiW